MTDSFGQNVLEALGTALKPQTVTYVGTNGRKHMFVARASGMDRARIDRAVRACRSVHGCDTVDYEIDCGDRALRMAVHQRSSRKRLHMASLVAQAAALAWAVAYLNT